MPPEGSGSEGSRSEESTGDERIPKVRFDEAVGKERDRANLAEAALKTEREERARERDERVRLDERIKALEKKPEAPEREHTRAELQSLVEDGKLTQGQADDILDRQRDRRYSRELDERLERRDAANQVQQDVVYEMRRYQEAIPKVKDQGSEERARVQTEFNYLIAKGDDPDSLSTQLKALRMAFGPVEKLQETTDATRETHQETGGAAEPAGGKAAADEPPKDLSPRELRHYQKGLDQGRYKNWDEVRAELKYKRRAA
jgi:hypothetical protein